MAITDTNRKAQIRLAYGLRALFPPPRCQAILFLTSHHCESSRPVIIADSCILGNMVRNNVLRSSRIALGWWRHDGGFTLLLLPEGKERCCVSCTTHGLNIRWQDDNDGFKTRNCILEAILGLENDHLSMPWDMGTIWQRIYCLETVNLVIHLDTLRSNKSAFPLT